MGAAFVAARSSLTGHITQPRRQVGQQPEVSNCVTRAQLVDDLPAVQHLEGAGPNHPQMPKPIPALDHDDPSDEILDLHRDISWARSSASSASNGG